ncbi:MAG: DUF1295 domain-containing protein [Eubacteriales bacterium]
MANKPSRKTSILIIAVIYILAAFIGYLVHRLFEGMGLLMSVFLADVAATIVVWLFGVLLKNASVYDPYWSVAPIVILAFWLFQKGGSFAAADIMLAVAILVWGVRLTYNWALNWQGMDHVDWRYEMLKEDNPKIWQLINFGGINMMPTILVYLGMIPAYYIIFNQVYIGVRLYIGFAICILCPAIQLIADKQMKDFRVHKEKTSMETGLWKYSRHPNYFGEIMFWWGIFIMYMGTVEYFYKPAAGALLITLLFVFISIPMMEKHVLKKYPEYESYQKRVSMVVPWFNR